MGWKGSLAYSRRLSRTCRNPLSLDMGWKDKRNMSEVKLFVVAIRFRWIWVEKKEGMVRQLHKGRSQSAFAGYGLKREGMKDSHYKADRRNPLSLDMGWKAAKQQPKNKEKTSQSAFAGYGLKSHTTKPSRPHHTGRNPLSLDMGWKDGKPLSEMKKDPKSQSAFAGYGLKRGEIKPAPEDQYRRNPLSLDMGWKAQRCRCSWRICQSRNPLSLDMGWKDNKNILTW